MHQMHHQTRKWVYSFNVCRLNNNKKIIGILLNYESGITGNYWNVVFAFVVNKEYYEAANTLLYHEVNKPIQSPFAIANCMYSDCQI